MQEKETIIISLGGAIVVPDMPNPEFIKDFKKDSENQFPPAKVASLIGRRFAMDRDENWAYIEKTYKLYSMVYPVFKIISSLDYLLFFTRGYVVIVEGSKKD